MANPKSFYYWMTTHHIHSDGLVGKLARDMKSDASKFTQGWSRHRNEAYLEMAGASTGIMKAFDEVWKEYEQYKADYRNG